MNTTMASVSMAMAMPKNCTSQKNIMKSSSSSTTKALMNPLKLRKQKKDLSVRNLINSRSARRRLQVQASLKEKAITAAALMASFALIPEAAVAADSGLSPSLKNFLLSIVAGGFVALALAGAVIAVANFDPNSRHFVLKTNIQKIHAKQTLKGGQNRYGVLSRARWLSDNSVKILYQKKGRQVGEGEEENEELSKKLELLKESHSILTTVEDRRLYDWSLARNGNPDIYVWPFEVDITQTQSPETPPPAEPEDEEPTKLLGYFMLAWLVLGFTLSIVLNR
ncbi:hypothetical protein LguiB_009626 [Lonicera macranthoides]